MGIYRRNRNPIKYTISEEYIDVNRNPSASSDKAIKDLKCQMINNRKRHHVWHFKRKNI